MPSVSGSRRSTTIASYAKAFSRAIASAPSAACVASNPSPDSESAISSRRSASSSTTSTLGWEVGIMDVSVGRCLIRRRRLPLRSSSSAKTSMEIHETDVADYTVTQASRTAREQSTCHSSRTRRSNVLVVDDEPEIRELLVEYFRDRGFETATAGDGRAAIAAIERDPARYRLIVSDLQMPGADGLAVLRAAKTANPSCYVVIITGYASLDSAIQAVRLRGVRLPDEAVLDGADRRRSSSASPTAWRSRPRTGSSRASSGAARAGGDATAPVTASLVGRRAARRDRVAAGRLEASRDVGERLSDRSRRRSTVGFVDAEPGGSCRFSDSSRRPVRLPSSRQLQHDCRAVSDPGTVLAQPAGPKRHPNG